METYRFLSEFTFKTLTLTEYIQVELEKVTNCKVLLEEEKKANPEMAQVEEVRKIDKVRSSVAKIVVTDIDMSEQTPTEAPPIKKVLKNPDEPAGPKIKANI